MSDKGKRNITMNEELQKALESERFAFDKFLEHSRLETKHSLTARKWRSEYTIAADEVRALRRDLLSAPIQSMYVQGN
jgi:hypothetical protein